MSKRTATTNRQRLALRVQKRLKPYLTGQQLQEWFKNEYNQDITTSSISRNLSAKYDWLDSAKDYQLDVKKNRVESWPELEKALYDWMLRTETESSISQELLRDKARQLWPTLYPDEDMPKFSNGWLHRFQNRRNIRANVHHSADSSSVDEDAEMTRIREVMSQYSSRDIFNCDETGLHWRLIPDKNPATRSIHKQRKDKARITLHFCTNSDASERLPIWLIGTATRPRAFRAAGINIENLGCHWRYDKNAWMTENIFKEWLCWFDELMTGRKVLLLMDNFSSHKSAVEEVSSQLKNTSIVWLPANSTANYQPLDLGIIRTWKAFWKRQWLFHMMREFDRGRDPNATMSILKAVRWAAQAWFMDLSQETIKNSFKKALAGETNEEMVYTRLKQEIQAGLNKLTEHDIKNVVSIDQFMNPSEEEVTDNLENLDGFILSQFNSEDAESDNDVHEVLPKVTASEALECIYKVRLFEEQQAKGNLRILNDLMYYERELLKKKNQNQHQTDFQSFFS